MSDLKVVISVFMRQKYLIAYIFSHDQKLSKNTCRRNMAQYLEKNTVVIIFNHDKLKAFLLPPYAKCFS